MTTAAEHTHSSVEDIIVPHEEMLNDKPSQLIELTGTSDERGGTMRALREPGLRCCRCDLCATRTQVVFGEGAENATVMIVGEAPGEQEDKSGHPFWGRAGQTLNALLEEAGIGRDEVWITNTVKCRPTNIGGKRLSNRPPRVPEIKACEIWRHGEIEILKPRVICCLGAVAARAILGRDVKMTIERGRWLPFTLGIEGMQDTGVILTYHPSYIMRQVGDAYERIRAQAAADFAIVAAKLHAGST